MNDLVELMHQIAQRHINRVPLPKADPRGNDWISRLPKIPQEEMTPFGAGEIPAALLLNSRGYLVRPDKNAIHPDDVINNHFNKSFFQGQA